MADTNRANSSCWYLHWVRNCNGNITEIYTALAVYLQVKKVKKFIFTVCFLTALAIYGYTHRCEGTTINAGCFTGGIITINKGYDAYLNSIAPY